MKPALVLIPSDGELETLLRERLPSLGYEVHTARNFSEVEDLLLQITPAAPVGRISTQGLEIDTLRFRSSINGRELKLTLTEFRLLQALAEKDGVVLTRRQLAAACLGTSEESHERTIDVHVKTLRQKLGDRAGLVETVRGVGYRLHEQKPTVPPGQ